MLDRVKGTTHTVHTFKAKQRNGMIKIRLQESTDAKNARDARNAKLNKQWCEIRRECNILERCDRETERGFISKFFVEHDGSEWYCSMRNGQVERLKELWKIEE